jgi:hypothetical protein
MLGRKGKNVLNAVLDVAKTIGRLYNYALVSSKSMNRRSKSTGLNKYIRKCTSRLANSCPFGLATGR